MADAFGQDLRLFVDKLDNRLEEVFTGTTEEVLRSVTFGSEITGAPGQPVDTGTLQGSFPANARREGWIWETFTKLEYGPPIEEGVGPYGPLTLRSKVGGFHSVAMTRAGWNSIVEFVRAQVVSNG